MIFTATFSTKFDARHGKIVLFAQDEDGVGGAQWRVRFGVTGPVGLTVKSLPTGDTWDLSFGPAGSGTFLVDIPVAGDEFMSGTYDIVIEYKDAQSGANPIIVESADWFYAPTVKVSQSPSVADLSISVDYAAETASASDLLSHTGWTNIAYLLELTAGASGGLSTSVSTRTVTATLTDSGPVDLTVEYSCTRRKTNVDAAFGIIQEELITGTKSGSYSPATACGVSGCAESFVCASDDSSLSSAAGAMRRSFIVLLASMFAKCGDKNKEQKYASMISGAENCGCK